MFYRDRHSPSLMNTSHRRNNSITVPPIINNRRKSSAIVTTEEHNTYDDASSHSFATLPEDLTTLPILTPLRRASRYETDSRADDEGRVFITPATRIIGTAHATTLLQPTTTLTATDYDPHHRLLVNPQTLKGLVALEARERAGIVSALNITRARWVLAMAEGAAEARRWERVRGRKRDNRKGYGGLGEDHLASVKISQGVTVGKPHHHALHESQPDSPEAVLTATSPWPNSKAAARLEEQRRKRRAEEAEEARQKEQSALLLQRQQQQQGERSASGSKQEHRRSDSANRFSSASPTPRSQGGGGGRTSSRGRQQVAAAQEYDGTNVFTASAPQVPTAALTLLRMAEEGEGSRGAPSTPPPVTTTRSGNGGNVVVTTSQQLVTPNADSPRREEEEGHGAEGEGHAAASRSLSNSNSRAMTPFQRVKQRAAEALRAQLGEVQAAELLGQMSPSASASGSRTASRAKAVGFEDQRSAVSSNDDAKPRHLQLSANTKEEDRSAPLSNNAQAKERGAGGGDGAGDDGYEVVEEPTSSDAVAMEGTEAPRDTAVCGTDDGGHPQGVEGGEGREAEDHHDASVIVSDPDLERIQLTATSHSSGQGNTNQRASTKKKQKKARVGLPKDPNLSAEEVGEAAEDSESASDAKKATVNGDPVLEISSTSKKLLEQSYWARQRDTSTARQRFMSDGDMLLSTEAKLAMFSHIYTTSSVIVRQHAERYVEGWKEQLTQVRKQTEKYNKATTVSPVKKRRTAEDLEAARRQREHDTVLSAPPPLPSRCYGNSALAAAGLTLGMLALPPLRTAPLPSQRKPLPHGHRPFIAPTAAATKEAHHTDADNTTSDGNAPPPPPPPPVTMSTQTSPRDLMPQPDSTSQRRKAPNGGGGSGDTNNGNSNNDHGGDVAQYHAESRTSKKRGLVPTSVSNPSISSCSPMHARLLAALNSSGNGADPHNTTRGASPANASASSSEQKKANMHAQTAPPPPPARYMVEYTEHEAARRAQQEARAAYMEQYRYRLDERAWWAKEARRRRQHAALALAARRGDEATVLALTEKPFSAASPSPSASPIAPSSHTRPVEGAEQRVLEADSTKESSESQAEAQLRRQLRQETAVAEVGKAIRAAIDKRSHAADNKASSHPTAPINEHAADEGLAPPTPTHL